MDYFYNVSGEEDVSGSGAAEGLHGFRFRRLYLTTDYTLSETFSGRARLEADEGTAGRPVVKDLSLTWAYAEEHRATVGITPPPAYSLAENVWGYRSFATTLPIRRDVVSSRDFGLRLDGPVGGSSTVRYAVMLANNGTVQPETDVQKRVYGRLHVRPTSRLLLVAGADHAGYADARDRSTRVSVFGGYSTGRARIGGEGYWSRLTRTPGADRTGVGGSVFAILQVDPAWEIVARVDRSGASAGGTDRFETFVLGGVAYQPHPNVMIGPNLRLRMPSDGATETTARVTLEVNF